MKTNQYTVREVPALIDSELRARAKRSDSSLNSTVLDVLKSGLGLTEDKPLYHDLDYLMGTWVEDKKFDQALSDMRKIDKEMWQ